MQPSHGALTSIFSQSLSCPPLSLLCPENSSSALLLASLVSKVFFRVRNSGRRDSCLPHSVLSSQDDPSGVSSR
ncbi:hypothetical protein VTN49DRAFT_3357 [Thermomyces lanuginosus]|uniref:uncharacterized protein n=1 Tax=Thermomyces lanuginosus TaxID=5541 RepID=UPI0037429598